MTENDIAQYQNGLDSTHESTENDNDLTTTTGGTVELGLHSATSNSASNTSANEYSTGLDNLVSSKSLLHEVPSTPLSSTSTPLFGVSSPNFPSTNSKYTTDKIPNTLGSHSRLFNSSTANGRSPSLFPTSSASSPSNSLLFNKTIHCRPLENYRHFRHYKMFQLPKLQKMCLREQDANKFLCLKLSHWTLKTLNHYMIWSHFTPALWVTP